MKNKIHPTAIIGDNVELGTGNEIGAYTVIGEFGFIRGDKERKGKVKIGNNNRIGNHVSIMAGENGITEIGDDNLIMNLCNVGHNTKIGSRNEIGAACIIAGHVTIGDSNRIKMQCGIRNRITIGYNNHIGMGTLVKSNIGNDSR